MRVVVHVYDALGNKLGLVPFVKSVSITRILDGAGSIAIEGFATDERALALFDNERRVRIYVEERESYLREIGSGIIQEVQFGITSGGFTLSLDGVDSLDELKRISTLINRKYEDETIVNVADSLTALAGWGTDIESSIASDLIDARFDGSSVLKALQVVAEQQGFHLRLGKATEEREAPGIVEIGHFGTRIPLRLINPETLPIEAYDNPNIAFIESMTIKEDTKAVANRIFVFGAGQNLEAALTLEHSTRSNPYEIKWRYGPDFRKLYYIEDADSIARYGVIERFVTFKEIAPLANNDFAIRRAANMLYDAAKTWLRQHAFQYISFGMTVKKCEQTVRPGDLVQITFRGVVEKDGKPFTWKSIPNADSVVPYVEMWVVKVTESVGVEGKSLRLEVANIDKHQASVARLIVGTLEQISVQGVKAQPSFNQAVFGPYRKEIDTTHSVTVPLRISDATYQLDLCRLRIKTTPFRATATGAAAAEIPVVTSSESGQHRHEMFFHTSDTPAGGTTTRQYAASDGDVGFINANFPTTAAGTMWTAGEASDHSHDVTIPSHSHDLDYGIHDDTLYPGLVKITVDGQVIAENLGTSDEGIDTEYDITEILNVNLRSTHQIEITCSEEGSQGVVEVEAELFSLILPIKLG